MVRNFGGKKFGHILPISAEKIRGWDFDGIKKVFSNELRFRWKKLRQEKISAQILSISSNLYAINQSERVNCWLLVDEVPTLLHEVRFITQSLLFTF